MLPFVLVSFRHGVKWGLFTGLVNGCLQILLGGGLWAPPTPTFLAYAGEVLLDYILAFMALGLAEFFASHESAHGHADNTVLEGAGKELCLLSLIHI